MWDLPVSLVEARDLILQMLWGGINLVVTDKLGEFWAFTGCHWLQESGEMDHILFKPGLPSHTPTTAALRTILFLVSLATEPHTLQDFGAFETNAHSMPHPWLGPNICSVYPGSSLVTESPLVGVTEAI